VNGHVELLKLLHVHGADMAIADEYGATPLHYAVTQMTSCVQHHHHQQQQQPALDAEVTEDDQVMVDGATCVDVRRAVLTRTEIVDCFDEQHRTPLIWAATCGTVRMLDSCVLFADEFVWIC